MIFASHQMQMSVNSYPLIEGLAHLDFSVDLDQADILHYSKTFCKILVVGAYPQYSSSAPR